MGEVVERRDVWDPSEEGGNKTGGALDEFSLHS